MINDFSSDALTTILFSGDFNDHSMNGPFHQQTALFRLFNMFNFHQVKQPPTRCANILDWFAINNIRRVINFDVSSPVRNLDHSLIFLRLNFYLCTPISSSSNAGIILEPTSRN